MKHTSPKSCLMWLLTCWCSIYRVGYHNCLYCIIHLRNPARLNTRSILHPCLFICWKNVQGKNDEGMGHDVMRPKMPSWISSLARNLFWISQATIKLSLSRTMLWAEINLSTVVAYSILYHWAIIFSIFRRWIVRFGTATVMCVVVFTCTASICASGGM